MATIKIKFRPSTNEGKEGAIYFQIIHERVVRQIKTSYKLYPQEWSNTRSKIVINTQDHSRKCYLQRLNLYARFDHNRLLRIVQLLESKQQDYSIDNIIELFEERVKGTTIFRFMLEQGARLYDLHRHRAAESYKTTLNSFMRFREGRDIALSEIDADLLQEYEAWLKFHEVALNTISFYMRTLRAMYNRALDRELIKDRKPFKYVFIGIDKTTKRALPVDAIKKISNLDLSCEPKLEFARDVFLFSLYTRGMSFVDIAYLRKKDVVGDVLTYRRRKTNQQLNIKWERCMQEIVTRHPSDNDYILPIITDMQSDSRVQYQCKMNKINIYLKEVARRVEITTPLTTYVARHSWASIAKSSNIPISVISQGMGHSKESTTQIYLASLDSAVVDKANKKILKLFK